MNIETILNAFLKFYECEIKYLENEGNVYFGEVIWHDENESRGFRWHKSLNNESLICVKNISEFIVLNKLNRNDRIDIPEKTLIELLLKAGWNRNEALRAIDYLMDFEIKMVIDGEETDSFFVHF